MATPAASQPPAVQGRPQNMYRGRGGQRRGGRGGNVQQNNSINATSTLPTQILPVDPGSSMPPSIQSEPLAASNNPATSRENGSRNNPRGGGRNRRGGTSRGGGRNAQIISGGGGRTFGGQLTSSAPQSDAGSVAGTPSLQGDAPEFRPGQPVTSRRPPPRAPARQRRMSKSQAPDLASRIHEDISNGLYECAVCVEPIRRTSKVWSCKTCWTVFHIHCIKKWAKNEGSTQARSALENGDMPPPRQWRCPGCNLPKDDLPTSYDCWCGKEIDPRNIPGLPPHSCGNTCGKERVNPKKCPHPCNLTCHAGPCPPCPNPGPETSCFCGKQSISRRCLDTDYDNGWSCLEICGDSMPNCDHTCERKCHEGLCGGCEIEVPDSKCYCGKTEKSMKCSDRDEEKESSGDHGDWIGSFDCKHPCERAFDCDVHFCQKTCHPQTLQPAHCPWSPDLIKFCPCGRTPLTLLLDVPRSFCQDPIPQCKKKCAKTLPCGHLCNEPCHTGECGACFERVSIACRCGRISSLTICHQGNIEPPHCSRVCKAVLNCGRHGCGERCCSGATQAAKRQGTKRKLGAEQDTEFEAEHICTRTCGRPLKCGNHFCQELCHKGPCGSCREAIFDEVSCFCGRTVIQPPLPCGTLPPLCHRQCTRPTPCGHPQILHNCHGDAEACPKCPYLMEKKCMCGKKLLKSQACFSRNVMCGESCSKILKCGMHFCRKSCHIPGECEDSETPCTQSCGRSKKFCPHSCQDHCHSLSCDEDKPCTQLLIVTCECQNLKKSVKCLASKTGEGNTKEVLPCNDECARLLRNQRLAKALDIDLATHIDDHIPYSQDTLQMFKDNIKWSQTQEREIRVFAADDKEKRLRFPPMKSHQRAFLHLLAIDFGLDSESLDPEPHRHIVLFKTPKFVSAPMKTLGQCVRVKLVHESTVSMSKKIEVNADPFNALVLINPRFALTTDELQADFARDFATVSSTLKFDKFFLPSEQILLKPIPINPTLTTENQIEIALQNLKPSISRTIASKKLAAKVSLCRVDSSHNILRREDEDGGKGGWSQVAAKGAAGPSKFKGTEGVGVKSAFTVLGNLAAKKERARKEREEEERRRKEREIESAPENWEDVAGDVEEEGKGAGSGGDDSGNGGQGVGDEVVSSEGEATTGDAITSGTDA